MRADRTATRRISRISKNKAIRDCYELVLAQYEQGNITVGMLNPNFVQGIHTFQKDNCLGTAFEPVFLGNKLDILAFTFDEDETGNFDAWTAFAESWGGKMDKEPKVELSATDLGYVAQRPVNSQEVLAEHLLQYPYGFEVILGDELFLLYSYKMASGIARPSLATSVNTAGKRPQFTNAEIQREHYNNALNTALATFENSLNSNLKTPLAKPVTATTALNNVNSINNAPTQNNGSTGNRQLNTLQKLP
jgi:hypothetical protein